MSVPKAEQCSYAERSPVYFRSDFGILDKNELRISHIKTFVMSEGLCLARQLGISLTRDQGQKNHSTQCETCRIV